MVVFVRQNKKNNVFSDRTTNIEKYWCWRRVVSLILLITFPSTLLTPILAYGNQDDLYNKNKFVIKDNINSKRKASKRDTKINKYKKTTSKVNEQPIINNLIPKSAARDSSYWKQRQSSQNHNNPIKIFSKDNKYQPYFEIGGAKYFNQKSKVAGIYDLFIPLLQTDDQLFFTDLRLFDRSGNSSEGNFHIGYRKLFPSSNKMLGIYGAFDLKKSEHGNRYNQIMFGAEYWQNK